MGAVVVGDRRRVESGRLERSMKWPLWRWRQDRQLDEELRSHLAMAIQDRIDCGESPEHAVNAARREFGNVLLVRETVRDMWGWTPIEQFWQDPHV